MRRHRFGLILLILSMTLLGSGIVLTALAPDAALAGEAAEPPAPAPAPQGEAAPASLTSVDDIDLEAAQSVSVASRARSLLGIGAILLLAFVFSSKRGAIRPRTVITGIALQFVFLLLLLWTTPGMWFFEGARKVVAILLSFTDAGSNFLFGALYRTNEDVMTNLTRLGEPLPGPNAPIPDGPIGVVDMSTGQTKELGVVFAMHVLPTIIFFSSLMSIMYHLGIMQWLVKGVAAVMLKFMRTSGSESLSCAANIFVGQTEAPLVVRPYLDTMTRSELMAIMTGGFATVAGGVMAAYVRFGIDAGHLMAASVMSAPAGLVIAKMMIPETEESQTAGQVRLHVEKTTENVIDAAAAGAADGFKLACNVGAMLLAFVALVAGVNFGLSMLTSGVNYVSGAGFDPVRLNHIFGVVFAPLAWCMGAESGDAMALGQLLGTKIAVNEFLAFIDLGFGQSARMHPRTVMIATYALCGFANFASIAIQIGGISSLAPKRRGELAKIGLKAMFAGALASWLTATLAGALAPAPGPAAYEKYYGNNVAFALTAGEDRFGDAVEKARLGLANARVEATRVEAELAALPDDENESTELKRKDLTDELTKWRSAVTRYETDLGRIQPLAAERWAALDSEAKTLLAEAAASKKPREAAQKRAKARAIYEDVKSRFGLVEYTSKADAELFKLGE